MMRALVILSLVMLTACAGARSFDQDLRQLEGRPVNDAAIMLGGPHTGSYKQGNATVYVWQGYKRESIFGPGVSKGRGYRLGSPMDDGSGLYWTGIEHYRCVIRATTTDGIVRKITMEGNPSGCETIYGGKREPLGKDFSD